MSAHAPVVVVMGVSGCGKSTVAAALAGRLGWDLQEGDALHPERNVAKMRSGIPLTDDDRWPWLDAVAAWIGERTAAGTPGVITCSALKRRYRDRLRTDRVAFAHLTGPRDVLAERLGARTGHFMPAGLLDSQLAALDPLGPDETGTTIDIRRPPAEQCAAIAAFLGVPPVDPGRGR